MRSASRVPAAPSSGRLIRTAGAVLVAAGIVSGCASTGSSNPPRSSVRSADHAQPLLSGTALPGLVTHDRVLTPSLLAQDADVPGILSELSGAGYLGGEQRTFQGPSRHLTFVESRSLQFATQAGAAAFLTYLHQHQDPWFGPSTQSNGLIVQGQRGYTFQPPACACHLANPVLIGVVRNGTRLAWLEINGPDANRPVLIALLEVADRAPA